MLLAKHVAGKSLTPAELRQRKNAARARWAVGGGTAIGAVIGGLRQHMATPRITVDALDAAQAGVIQRAGQRGARIVEAIRLRTGARQPMEAGAPVGPRVVGTAENRHVYDFQIDALNRRIRRAAPGDAAGLQEDVAALERLKSRAPRRVGRAGTTRFRTSRQAEEAVRLIDAQILAARRSGALATDLLALQRLRTEASTALDRLMSGGRVRAAVERKFRQGETGSRLEARIRGAKSALRGRERTLLATLERRTAMIHDIARERVIREVRGHLRLRLARGAGTGGLLGASIGLTAVGLGLLARHIIAASERKKSKSVQPVAKAEPDWAGATDVKSQDSNLQRLEKARRSTEDSMGIGLARAYRRWIDRLLGKNEDPMNLGDGIAEAVSPGLTEAFADGARDMPIDKERSDPKSWLEVDFDVLNPSVRRHMTEYALDRIVEITAVQRAAIRDAIMKQSVLQGIGPNEVARTIRESIGLTAFQQNVVNGFRQGLEDLDPRVLDRKLRDRRYDGVISRAIENNEALSPEQINAMVDAYHRRMLALRARTIARTEGLRATSYGGLARAQQVLDENPDLEVTKKWLSTADERTRDTHVDLNGREVEGMLTAFVTSKGNQIRWPLDDKAVAEEVIACRCALQFIFHPKRGVLRSVAA